MSVRAAGRVRVDVRTFEDGAVRRRSDLLAGEEPLEIRLVGRGEPASVAVTMRTPGHDFELAAGFLLGEGVVSVPGDVRRVSYCVDRSLEEEQRYNVVNVELRPGLAYDAARLERHFGVTSACGVCGKASLEAVRVRGVRSLPAGPVVSAETLYELPDKLRGAQGLFEATGGLHAAGLFTTGGELVAAREDVGRHNAVDKLLGWALLSGRWPLSNAIVLVSGRAGFEIAQKCVAARVPLLCAVSAPSSLAVTLAREFGLTLVGFLRGRRLNVYAGFERVEGERA